jgi:hypothetical protein
MGFTALCFYTGLIEVYFESEILYLERIASRATRLLEKRQGSGKPFLDNHTDVLEQFTDGTNDQAILQSCDGAIATTKACLISKLPQNVQMPVKKQVHFLYLLRHFKP